MNKLFSPIAALVALLAFSLILGTAKAEQTSLDRRIFEAFEKIDDRTSAHEETVAERRTRLDGLTRELAEIQKEMESLDEGREKATMARRRLVQSRMINTSAEYISVAYNLVDSAAGVISANLTDLADLAEELREVEPGKGRVAEIRQRIDEGVRVGKSVRIALGELRRWAHQDPTLAARFNSLKRIAASLDRRISVDKARVQGQGDAANGRVHDKRIESIDRSIDRLSDMYTEVAAEKEAIIDLRDEVAMAIQLGRLEMTRQIAETAIPSLSAKNSPAQDLTTLREVADGIAKLNNSIIVETEVAEMASGGKSKARRLSVGSFTNF
jgi:hypothetical protein